MKPEDWNYDELLNCMRCGFCLPTCPTYIQFGNESNSPRGRIAMMKAVADGEMELQDIEEQMYVCLGCRNCEAVCPSGVKYGSLLEDAREALVELRPRNKWRRIFLDGVFRHNWMLKVIGALLWFYQVSGLHWLTHKTGLIRILPQHLAQMDGALPRVKAPWARKRPMTFRAVGEKQYRVALFTGCVMDLLFWETNQSAIRALCAAGCEVVLVEGQQCCGALHAHAGEKDGARELAKKNIRAFLDAKVDFVVNTAGGCGAALKEYHHWFKGDAEWERLAHRFAGMQRDFSELLATLEMPKMHTLPAQRVTMQESCHLAHGQGIRNQPRKVLKALPGIQYVEMVDSDRCCGSAGIYNLTQPETSMNILDGKMVQVESTQATTLVTTNPGCLLQMRLGIQRAGMTGKIRAVHLADLVGEALEE